MVDREKGMRIQAGAALLLLLVLLGREAYAEDPADAEKPTTKLEELQSRSGVGWVIGRSQVGFLNDGMGVVTVEARELIEAANPNSRSTGIAIKVEESGRLGRTVTAYVDSDEIDSLLQAIDYLSRITREATKQEEVDATYKTRGNLSLSVFSERGKKQLSLGITAGRIAKASALLEQGELAKLRELILSARARL